MTKDERLKLCAERDRLYNEMMTLKDENPGAFGRYLDRLKLNDLYRSKREAPFLKRIGEIEEQIF